MFDKRTISEYCKILVFISKEGCRMRTNIQYDFTSFNDFLNTFETPLELVDDLTNLVMNYALAHDENQTEVFKRDIDTLYVLIQEIRHLREQQIA